MTAAPLYEEPEVTLERWSFVRHPDGTIHIAGLRHGVDYLSRLRMSTPIVSFDLATLTAGSTSGRVYHLAKDGHSPLLGRLLAKVFFDERSAAEAVELSPEEVELSLAEPSSGFRH